MKAWKKRFATYLLLILALGFLVTQTTIGTILLASPWWVYLVLIGIFLSGYLSFKYSLEDKQVEKEWIEQEGNVYIERIQQEKEAREVKRASNKVGV